LVALGPSPEQADPAAADAVATGSVDYQPPPRIDGFYLGGAVHTAISEARVANFDTTLFYGGGGNVNVGAAVYPWMTIGFEGRGAQYFNSRGQQMFQGGVIAEAGFYPVPKYPFSLHVGLGFGLAYVEDDSQIAEKRRSALGFPQFLGSARYEFFPGSKKRRPYRPGGFSIGPEIGWRGWTPSKRGRPMANAAYIAIWLGYYWGR
jgi:hypothetical protein